MTDHIKDMTEAELSYYFDIPAALVRSGEDVNRTRNTDIGPPKRRWTMPTAARIARLKKAEDKQREAAKRATAKDLKAANDVAEKAEQAAALTRKVTK